MVATNLYIKETYDTLATSSATTEDECKNQTALVIVSYKHSIQLQYAVVSYKVTHIKSPSTNL